MIGRRIGAYDVLGKIGEGGMGEVYKARDTRLDRFVALKILPDVLAADPQFRERFEREARAISQLSHPHICVLHDVGHQDGTDFLVMEYLEGETLEQRLKKGALPLQQALQYGTQIADALDTAHRAGVVHRDLKPANVILTRSGAKLLFWTGQDGGARRDHGWCHDAHDTAWINRSGQHSRHAAIHGARAARGSRRRCADRHLRVRDRAVRDGHRTESVRGQDAGEHDCRHSRASRPLHHGGAAARAGGARSDRPDLPGLTAR